MSFLTTLIALIYLSYNMANGGILVLSDGSRWEISPSDQTKTSLWMTPMEIEIKPSDNPNYPYMLVNMQTKQTVYAKVSQADSMQNQPQDIITDQNPQAPVAPQTPIEKPTSPSEQSLSPTSPNPTTQGTASSFNP